VGLYQHLQRSGDSFSPLRTGLDHLAFEVTDESELEAWRAYLDEAGFEHSPVRDIGHSAFVSFEDPDGIQFGVWFTRVPHRARENSRVDV
jgi:glyoxylase I family protein